VTDRAWLAELKRRAEHMDARGPVFREDVDWLIAAVERRGDLLKRLEWAGERAMFAACPACENWQEDGHKPGCELAREIAGGEA
jgi:hypothetical protein